MPTDLDSRTARLETRLEILYAEVEAIKRQSDETERLDPAMRSRVVELLEEHHALEREIAELREEA